MLVLALLSLSACGGRPQMPMHVEEAWKGHGPLDILRKFAGPDGRLTRTELEAGLRQEFEAADTNHNGVLDPDEARAVNRQRWSEDQSAISPLQDWNADGVIDFNEFAATARALFNELDQDHNGVLTPQELRLGQQPGGPQGDKPAGEAKPPRPRGGH